jgi:DNA-binding GntR family transcriptional regulator
MVIEKRNLADQIYGELKDNILKNKIKLGEKISVNAIANTYKVSHTPIREAIKSLVKDGLIVDRPNKMYSVFDIKEKDLIEVMDVRKMCECYSIDKAIRNVEPTIFKNIYKKVKELKSDKEKTEKRGGLFYKSDLTLHKTIVEGTHNSKLIEIYHQIYDIVNIIIFRIDYKEKYVDNFIDEHIEILRLILKKDIKNAKELLGIHIDHSCKYYLENLLFKDSN